MTHHPIRTKSDGTRVYSNYTTYKPVAPEKRKYAVRKPDDPRAVRWYGEWFLPLDTLPDEERVMPETIPDEVVEEHHKMDVLCQCPACSRPMDIVGKYRRRAMGYS